jgi:hypothetical protein
MNELFLCKGCNISKNFNEFNKCSSSNNGLQYKCRECEKEYKINNSAQEKRRKREYRSKNKESIKQTIKNWTIKNKDHIKQQKKEYNSRPEVKERNRIKQKERWLKNPDKYRQYQNQWTKNQRKTNPHYKMRHRLQSRIRIALIEGKGTKFCPTMEITGISLAELKIHIENQFTEGMTWEKFLNSEIEIDHIKPCCAFDLSKEEEQKKCFHYTNLRPMWAEDNKNKIASDLKQRFIREENTTKDISI